MTVYELIQELCNYKPDAQVVFKVYSDDFEVDTDVTFDVNGERIERPVTVTARFDDYVNIDGIYYKKSRIIDEVVIDLR